MRETKFLKGELRMKTHGVNITGITCDSRKVREGYAFVAIKGSKLDGNDYIDMAIENGASIIFTERDVTRKDVPLIKVENARVTLAQLLNEFYDYPSEKMKLVGITGTNGKTTTTYLIGDILKHAGYKVGLIGTLGVKVQDEYLPATLTTPEPEVLIYLLNEMVQMGIEVVVMEVSSHGLKLERTWGLDFDVAIHTNISEDHMDFHESFEDYVKTKKKLFDSLSRNKIAILNTDDKSAKKLIEDNNKALVITYGLANKSSITASSMQIKISTQFTLCIQRGLTTLYGKEIEPAEYPINLNLTGKHNVYNTLAAIAASLYFGVEIEEINESLSAFKGIKRRLDKIYDKDYRVYDDFCHNPASYEAVFETVQGMDYNDIIIINAIRGNRGIKINRDNAKAIVDWYSLLGAKKIILSLSNDTVTEKDKVASEEVIVYKRMLTEAKINFEIMDTLKKSIDEALKIVNDRDIILLLGAQGMDNGKEIFYNILKLQEKNIG